MSLVFDHNTVVRFCGSAADRLLRGGADAATASLGATALTLVCAMAPCDGLAEFRTGRGGDYLWWMWFCGVYIIILLKKTYSIIHYVILYYIILYMLIFLDYIIWDYIRLEYIIMFYSSYTFIFISHQLYAVVFRDRISVWIWGILTNLRDCSSQPVGGSSGSSGLRFCRQHYFLGPLVPDFSFT